MKINRLISSSFKIPIFISNIQAGFPSPADDYLEDVLSLDEICMVNISTTFLGRVMGKSLADIQVCEGDIMVIDKSLEAKHGDLIVAVINSEFTAKFLKIDGNNISLWPANKNFKPIIIDEFSNFKVWGVVTKIVIDVKNRWSACNS